VKPEYHVNSSTSLILGGDLKVFQGSNLSTPGWYEWSTDQTLGDAFGLTTLCFV
ncbi:hypothetical protein GIB67_011784, partial [Kingdonia uniflora]